MFSLITLLSISNYFLTLDFLALTLKSALPFMQTETDPFLLTAAAMQPWHAMHFSLTLELLFRALCVHMSLWHCCVWNLLTPYTEIILWLTPEWPFSVKLRVIHSEEWVGLSRIVSKKHSDCSKTFMFYKMASKWLSSSPREFVLYFPKCSFPVPQHSIQIPLYCCCAATWKVRQFQEKSMSF